MYRRFSAIAVFCLALVLGSPAEARKGRVPCTGETLIKVLIVPVAKPIRGRHVDLGYLYTPGCTDGRWVGHFGTHYQEISLEEAEVLAIAAGSRELPPEPGLLGHPDIRAMLFIAFLIALAFAIVGLLKVRQLRKQQLEVKSILQMDRALEIALQTRQLSPEPAQVVRPSADKSGSPFTFGRRPARGPER